MESIRGILAAHESGISRDGLLAWARLRIDPQLTDAQLDAALAELGDQVVDEQGFLYLREHAPEGAGLGRAPGGDASRGTGTTPGTSPAPGSPVPQPWEGTAEQPPSGAVPEPPPPPPPPAGWAAPGLPGWVAPDGQPAQPEQGGPAWTAPDGAAWPPAAQPSGNRTMLMAAVAVGAFLLVAGVGAFLLGEGDQATPALPTPNAGTVINADDLVVGDCVILPSEDQFDELRRLACTEPHDGEVFFIGDHPGGDYPSDDAFQAFVDEQCLPAFAAYTGSAYEEQGVLDVGWFTPTSGAWDRGDRGVTCHLTPIDGSRTSQSYRGANP